MKKLLALAAAITLLCTAALAEFDFYALKDTPDTMTYTVPGTADTVVRPALAPYQGEFGEDELVAYLDYIILPDEEVATFRLCLSLSMFDSFQADEVRVFSHGKPIGSGSPSSKVRSTRYHEQTSVISVGPYIFTKSASGRERRQMFS